MEQLEGECSSSSGEDKEILFFLFLMHQRRRRLRAAHRQIWTKRWTQQRCNANLTHELNAEDPETFCQFHRLDRESFDKVLEKVTPLISKKDTQMRCALKASERLSVTLRFLATGL